LASSASDLLSPLQRRVLDLFFASVRGFFLTGGAALGGFHLRHRRTRDLDLFTTDEGAFESAVRAFPDLCRSAGLTIEEKAASPRFRRFVVSDGTETLPVDLVRDVEYQVAPEKPRRGAIVIDSLDDLFVNKICALLSRSEVRDLVDLLFLEREGFRLVRSLPDAQRKDAAATAANLAFVLSGVVVREAPKDLERPVTREDLRAFVERTRAELARLAFPGATGKPPP
jgi:hypothetical protein